MKKMRVFLADDHVLVRQGLRLLIASESDMEIIGECGDGREAVEKALEMTPDVMVMDVSMPRCNGVLATEEIVRACPAVRILILTAREDLELLGRLFRMGASGCVLKRSAAEDLALAIRRVAKGEIYMDPTLGARLAIDLGAKPQSEGRSHTLEPSSREAQILRLIAWGYSNKEISAKLDISVKTVETHKARLMEKLGLKSRTEMVHYAVRQGWLEEE